MSRTRQSVEARADTSVAVDALLVLSIVNVRQPVSEQELRAALLKRLGKSRFDAAVAFAISRQWLKRASVEALVATWAGMQVLRASSLRQSRDVSRMQYLWDLASSGEHGPAGR